MEQLKEVSATGLINMAYYEIIRLGYKRSAVDRHTKVLREFAEYCENNRICNYDQHTGTSYFLDRYGVDLTKQNINLTPQQRETRCTIRLLDDIYQFGYGRRNSNRDFRNSNQYHKLLEDYLKYCKSNNASAGTLRVKKTKLWRFLFFLEGRNIAIDNITAADISEFMITLSGYSRSTLHVFTSVLSCFMKYLYETHILNQDLSSFIPKPKIYAEENIPQTWTAEEVQKLLSAVERTSAVGKRDYAMILLAVMLGMRAGDICTLRFSNFDWKRKVITYVQQKTKKTNTLPILPEIGEAIIDYLKNGRLESDCDFLFIKHISPYGGFTSSSALSENIKKYMKFAGIEIKSRKAAHSLRHTLASTLLQNETPIITISDVLGHFNTATTIGYTKVDIPALRQCALSYGKMEGT